MTDDGIGTIRVCEHFGSIAVYIKTGDNSWRTMYVDPGTGAYLSPGRTLSDAVASSAPVVFSPKPVV